MRRSALEVVLTLTMLALLFRLEADPEETFPR